jgi:hypothetical protein
MVFLMMMFYASWMRLCMNDGIWDEKITDWYIYDTFTSIALVLAICCFLSCFGCQIAAVFCTQHDRHDGARFTSAYSMLLPSSNSSTVNAFQSVLRGS